MTCLTAFHDPLLTTAMAVVEAQHAQLVLVGGAVRDVLLGKPLPPDLDFLLLNGQAQTLGPAFAQGLQVALALTRLPKVVMLDAEWGIIRVVVWPNDAPELPITIDIANALDNDLQTDLFRRDVTVNAIAWDGQQFVDPAGGRKDLANAVIKAVKLSNLAEDPLRVLRVFRTASLFPAPVIAAETLEACEALAHRLADVAKERVVTEWLKLLSAPLDRLQALLPQMPYLLPYFTTLPDAFALQGLQRFQQALHAVPDLVALTAPPLSAYPQRAWLVWLALGADTVDTLSGYPLSKQAQRYCQQVLLVAGKLSQELPTQPEDWCALWRQSGDHVPGALALLCPGVLPPDVTAQLLDKWQTYQAMAAQTPPLVTGAWVIAQLGITPDARVSGVLDSIRDGQLAGTVNTVEQVALRLPDLLARL
jgi:tRNA nucleotidyltransferase/poly(A) polymerase